MGRAGQLCIWNTVQIPPVFVTSILKKLIDKGRAVGYKSIVCHRGARKSSWLELHNLQNGNLVMNILQGGNRWPNIPPIRSYTGTNVEIHTWQSRKDDFYRDHKIQNQSLITKKTINKVFEQKICCTVRGESSRNKKV